MASVVVFSGCGEPVVAAKSKADIAGLKFQDFSELKVPGESGYSAIFIVGCYEVDIDKLAAVRIFAGQMRNALPQSSRSADITADGIFAAVVAKENQEKMSVCLDASMAKLNRKITLMFYDSSPEDFWFTDAADTGRVNYKDIDGKMNSLNMADGFLGLSFAVSFKKQLVDGLPLTISPVYQNKNVIPGSFLQKTPVRLDNGRMVLENLSFSAIMNAGDAILVCPDIIPLDNSTFSKYAFSGSKDTKYKIYCILCKSITGI